MADGTVGLAADGPGKKVDVAELTRADGTVVERQRIVHGDPDSPTSLAKVSPEGRSLVRDVDIAEVIMQLKRIARGLELVIGEELPNED